MSDRESLSPREARAYHEAGHAVAGTELGMLLGDLSLLEDDPGSGCGVVWDDRSARASFLASLRWSDAARRRVARRQAEQTAVMLAAGVEAVVLARGGVEESADRRGAAADLAAQRGLLGPLATSEKAYDLLQLRIRKRAERLLRRASNWRAVCGLAAFLLERGALTGDEVRARIAAAQHRRAPPARRLP